MKFWFLTKFEGKILNFGQNPTLKKLKIWNLANFECQNVQFRSKLHFQKSWFFEKWPNLRIKFWILVQNRLSKASNFDFSSNIAVSFCHFCWQSNLEIQRHFYFWRFLTLFGLFRQFTSKHSVAAFGSSVGRCASSLLNTLWAAFVYCPQLTDWSQLLCSWIFQQNSSLRTPVKICDFVNYGNDHWC